MTPPAPAPTLAKLTDPALRTWAEGAIAAATAAPTVPYILRTDRIAPTLSDVAAARARLLTLPTEAEKAEVLRFIAAATGAQADFDAALAMALAARVRGDPLAPAEASLALARQVKDRAQAERAFAQAFDAAQKINVKYK